MALGREEVITETVNENPLSETAQVATADTPASPTIAQLPVGTSNQEAMVAQTLKRVKRQSKEIERIAKTLKGISDDVAGASKGQGKQLKQLQGELNRVSAAIKRLQNKDKPKPRKRASTSSSARRNVKKKASARKR